MGTERSEYLLIVLDKSYLEIFKMTLNKDQKFLNEMSVDSHFNVGLTGGAARAAGTLFASTNCPFTADVELLTFPGGALTLFDVKLLFDCGCASVEVTVVLETCREPDDRRPLDDPKEAITFFYRLLIRQTISTDYLNSVSFDCLETMFVVVVVVAQSGDYHRFLDFLAVMFL